MLQCQWMPEPQSSHTNPGHMYFTTGLLETNLLKWLRIKKIYKMYFVLVSPVFILHISIIFVMTFKVLAELLVPVRGTGPDSQERQIQALWLAVCLGASCLTSADTFLICKMKIMMPISKGIFADEIHVKPLADQLPHSKILYLYYSK